MIFLLIGIALGVLFVYKVFGHDWGYEQSRAERAGFGFVNLLMVTGIACIVALFGSIFAGAWLDTEPVVVGTKPIVALKDKSEVSGQFFLGTGSVEGELVYYAMVDTGGGAYQPQQFAISEVKIHENSNASPRVDTVELKFKGSTCWLWALGCESQHNREYHFYIPQGSIDRQFKLDLEG